MTYVLIQTHKRVLCFCNMQHSLSHMCDERTAASRHARHINDKHSVSRRRHNYISRLNIPCRTNCIVSACPLYESQCARGVVRGAWWRRHSQGIPSEVARRGCSTPLVPRHSALLVPRFTFHPCPTMSLAHISPLSPWTFNYQQSIFGHVPQSFEVQSGGRPRGAFWMLRLIVIYAHGVCADDDIPKLTSFDVFLPSCYLLSKRGIHPYI